jgi:hypothetical protein
MTSYTFRAELSLDAIRLFQVEGFLQNVNDFTITRKYPFSNLVEFTSNLTIEQVRDYMKKVSDGHRMIQTLNYSDKYDGEMWYSESDD